MAGGLTLDDIPDTRDSLLIRVANSRDQGAWEQFARIYRPVVYNVARMRGLQDADAQDVAQQVLIAVSRALPTWQRRDETTLFRHWLCRIARNAAINAMTRQPRDLAMGGDAGRAEADRQVDDDLDSQIEREYRRQMFRHAAVIVRSRADEITWRAFALTMIDGLTISEAACQLNKSEAVIYAARSRIMRRLRDAVNELEEE
jgi:RNA polymerase sigma-70 factor (ECF subfamily)